MTRRLSTFALALATSGLPTLLLAAPNDGTPHIMFTKIDLADACGCANTFGWAADGKLVGLTLTNDASTVAELGLGTYDNNDMVIFGQADMRLQLDEPVLNLKALGSAMLTDTKKVMKFDARIVTNAILDAGLKVEVKSMTAVLEGNQLILGTNATVGAGTKTELKSVKIADETYGALRIADTDIVLFGKLTKAGSTLMFDKIGTIDPATKKVTNLDGIALAAFGLGIASTSTRTPQSKTAQPADVAAA